MMWPLLMLLLLAGCSLSPHPPVHQPETLHYYPLLPPASYGRALGLTQLLQGHFEAQQFQLHTQLEIDPEQILVVGFTAFQTRAFVMRYDGKTVQFENFTDRKMPFPPEMILSDIQQVLWPTLPNRQGWRVVDHKAERLRQVFFADHLVTQIQYNGTSPTDGDVALSNRQYGYQLRIHTVAIQH